jgi:hypothetical protein
MGAEDFATWAYNVLETDPRFSQFLEQLITPSKEAKRKAQASGVAGAAVGHFLGVGWKTISRAAISFKEEAPIWLMTFTDHKEPDKTKVCFYFPISGYVSDRDFRKMEVKPRKEGVISRKVVGVKYDFDCVGKSAIESDRALRDILFQLFSTQKLCDISDWTQTPMTVELERKNSGAAGKIETGIETLDANGLKMLLDAASRIADHMKSETKLQGQPNLDMTSPTLPPPPPPPPEIQEDPNIPDLQQNTLWVTTWGQLCEQFIQKEGIDAFGKEYSPEMAMAYNRGILNVIPSLNNSLQLASSDQRQILDFVETSKYWARGYPTLQGPRRTDAERRIRVREFMHQLVPPSIKDTPQTWPPQVPQKEKNDPILAREGAPNFMVQSRFLNLSYKIFEFGTEERARQTMNFCNEIIGQTFAPNPQLAELIAKMLPGINQTLILQATGTISLDEQSVLVSRRVIPRVYPNVKGPMDSTGGFGVDYLIMWQKGARLFSVYEPNVISIWDGQEKMAYGNFENTNYDAQVLINALTAFQSNQLFEKGLTMLKYFQDNKQHLRGENF